MAGRFNRSRSERGNAVGILASFFVIVAGLGATVVITTVSVPNPFVPTLIAVAVFTLIGAIPLLSVRERSRDAGRIRFRGPSLFQRLRTLFSPHKPEEKPDLVVWKRKKNEAAAQNQESCFVEERGPERFE